jgi:CheY-like chemotaxis protein
MVGPRVPVRVEAVVGETGEACRAVVTDVRERNRMEAERLILNKLECTGILAGGIAHDFNNLLAVIVLDVELALASWGGGGETGSLLEEAMRTALTARGLTQQLITFSKGGVPVRRPTHLAATIRDAVRLGLSGSRVRWEFDLAEDLWRADVDGDQIGQVVRALVLNAREAMPGGGVIRVRAWNEVRFEADGASVPAGDYVRVSVADHGTGIAPEVLPRIFDPYFSTKERGDQKGMGLGLTICHSIVRRHGGVIGVETVVGEGSVIHVHLPRHMEGGVDRVVSAGESGVWPRRVLVMDDDAPLRAVVGSWLRRMGHEAHLVADGGRAIEAYAAAIAAGRRFDAVLLDLTVRGGPGGVETVKALRVIDPGVIAIVMSGYADDPVLQDPLVHGFRAGLAKPFVGEGLREVFSRVGAGRGLESPGPRVGVPEGQVFGEGP